MVRVATYQCEWGERRIMKQTNNQNSFYTQSEADI